MEYEFEVLGTIVGKERPRVNTYTGLIYTPNRTKDYEDLIRQSFKIKYPRFEQITSRIEIDIVSYMKIPNNTSKVKTEKMLSDEISPTKKPDIDNIAKSVLDALNKFVIKDDNQVSKLSVLKKYGQEEKLVIIIKEY